MNSFESYYSKQAETGIAIYSHRNMKGHGFFGRFIGSTVVPLVSKFAPLAVKGARHLLDSFEPRPLGKKRRRAKRAHSSRRKKPYDKKLF